jgi:VWFA-related protein
MRALGRLEPQGGTAMYDAVAEAVRIAERGRHRKKALLLISDGNDTSSATALMAVKQLIRQTEVLVYAIGIDARAESSAGVRWQRGAAARILSQRRPPRPPIPLPFPIPGGRRPPPTWPPRNPPKPQPNPPSTGFVRDSPANEEALREITDDSGGRTEMIRSANDLDPSTAGIADELSRQYYLGYSPTGKKDGLWHTIEVRVGDQSYHVRARRGYVATP